MAFKVFLTHGLDPSEQALAWRLQTLAASYGIEMYVPQRNTALPPLPGAVSIQSAIDRSDCVLAIITADPDVSVKKELQYAKQKRKLVIPIVQSDFTEHPLLAQFPRIFTFSPFDDPGALESKVVEFLRQQNISKKQQQQIGALVGVGAGLLLLYALSQK
jgi:hypothetical protein